ncbi:MAG: S8/S53 family peptidase [Acidobacteriaceae bacterium]|nr:S8/S53 family peptidase [Acidobacteriaceae bacterium]
MIPNNAAARVRQRARFFPWRPTSLAYVLGLTVAAVVPSMGATGRVIEHNTPNVVTTAKNLGPANSAEIIDVSIRLNLHNQDVLDSLAEEVYDAASSRYHAWLTREEIQSRFAPTEQEVRTVGEFLSSHNLPVVAVGPFNFFVRARGTVADVQKAFHVQINSFEIKGKPYRVNISDPYVEGPAAALTRSVAGLDNLEYQHPLVKPVQAKRASGPGFQSANAPADSSFFTSDCFTGVKTESYSSNGALPTGTYRGNSYNGSENSAGCGYTPAEIQTAYNLTGLYKEGFDGTGQTIVIIDWCGSETITGDANAFSARFGLPPLTSSNFKIINTAPSSCAAPDPEINIDVEWAHAIAPGANIDLVVPPSASFMDVDDAELYAIANSLGNVISGSYGSEELYTPTATLTEENLLNEVASLLGISANFATGDSGDFTLDIGPPFFPATVLAPADSPYATGVGGVTLALKSDNTMAWQAGWGNNETLLVEPGFVLDPPANFGFVYGSGGGPSAVFSKPSFQSKLPGTHRLLPDISWLADPFTGGIIAISEPFVYPPVEWTVYGGTSLATPMFSALWAIANEEAGIPLGQAARRLYSMPSGTITDVVPVGSSTNVTASITDFLGTTNYTAAQLAAPLEGTTKFYSALWNIPLEEDFVYVITFGTDTGLKTAPGWDDVTGLGTPNGKAFADFFSPGTR